jgi:hypothetical protein
LQVALLVPLIAGLLGLLASLPDEPPAGHHAQCRPRGRRPRLMPAQTRHPARTTNEA